MAADCQRRLRKGQIDCGREVGRSRHQGGGAESACLLQLNDGPVDAWRETKVVRVDDQALHCRQCTKTPFFFSRIEKAVRKLLEMWELLKCERRLAMNYSYGLPRESATIGFL